MKPKLFSRTERTLIALLAIGAIAICVNGCSQLDQQAAVANAQKTLAATTQAVDQAQQAIVDLQAQVAKEQKVIKDAQAVLTTQPSDPTATKALAATESALNASQKALATATDYVTKAKPAIDSLNAALNAIQNGQTPNFAPLGALGPYGTIAAVVLTLGYGAWQKYQNVKLITTNTTQAQQIAVAQPVVDHLQDVTGTSTPVAAAAVASSAVRQQQSTATAMAMTPPAQS